jgi:hypothetical protein
MPLVFRSFCQVDADGFLAIPQIHPFARSSKLNERARSPAGLSTSPASTYCKGSRREQKKTKKELALRHSVVVNYITDGRWHRSQAFYAATLLTSQRQNLEENET